VRIKPFVGIVMVVSTLCLVISSLWLRAQHPLSPHPDFADALWLAHADGIRKIAPEDATVLFTVTDAKDVWALAVDAPRGVLWAYGRHTLSAYRLNGQPFISVPLTPSTSSGNSKDVSLSVNPDDGSVWLGVKKFLYHFDAHGQWLRVHSLPEPIQALAWDPARACLWVGTKERVQALDDTGALCATLGVGAQANVRALAVDATAGTVWVGLHNGVQHYDASGTLRFELRLDKLAALEGDQQGGVWVAADRELLYIDRSGLPRLVVEPFGHAEKIVDLAVDPRGASVWVASKKRLSHLGVDGRRLHEVELRGEVRDLAFYADVIPPSLAFTVPQDGVALNTNTPSIALHYRDSGAGVDATTLVVQANGVDVSLACQYSTSAATCIPTEPLPEGRTTLTAAIRDYAGNMAEAPDVRITIDTMAPVIALTTPADGLVTHQAQQTFVGALSEAATLTLNGTAVAVGPDLAFTQGPVSLQDGLNTFELMAIDVAGNRGQRQVRVTLDTVAPAAVSQGQVEVRGAEPGQVRVTGLAGSVEAGTRVTLTNLRTGQAVTVTAEADGSFTATLSAQPGDVVALVVADAAGNVSPETQVPVSGLLPPDPGSVAPPLDRTVSTDLASATAFLYSGSNPIQTGVAPGTIEPRRVAVLRGQVKTRDDAPLPGVTVTILGHPEFGQTLTRADGMFDLAVNGGGLLTVRYEKEGHMPVQRQVQAPWRDYAWLPEVVLLPYDAQVTAIDLTAPSDIQVARGSMVTDADGSRQATLLFTPGTQATMILPDGSAQPLTTLHVRATEYTVGDNGPAAMPGALPPASAYTYAVELSVDEAVAAGATEVRFTQPVVFYVDNFLNFPVGGIVPVGYYDRARGLWIPSDNGRIVQVLDVTGGLAALDADGDGTADEGAALTALGITAAEQRQLATLYQPGQRLWRVPISHFTPWDCNWPYSPPDDAEPPRQPKPKRHKPIDDPTCQGGSIIECQNQTLGEVVDLPGTFMRLHYQSDRVAGRTAAKTIEIPLSGPSLPSSLKRLEVDLTVVGRRFSQSVPAAPNQSMTFTWDGQDAFGRTVQGGQPVTVRIGYVYDAVYREPAQFAQSFGATGGAPLTANRARQEITLWQESQTSIGAWEAQTHGLGGWSFDIHHAYDSSGRVLYLGDGRRRSADAFVPIITTIAGTGTYGGSGDGGPATQAELSASGIALGPDGSLFIADIVNSRIRHVGPDGMITTVAGNGTPGYGGDGGPAIQANLNVPRDVAVGPDGSLYIADEGNHRVRRVTPNGVITTVAGNGYCGEEGDGGPATQAQVCSPSWVATGPDGSLYISTFSYRIRRVDPDGLITTVAGNGTNGRKGDGGPATQAQLTTTYDIAVGPDGSLYIAVGNDDSRIRRVSPDGLITTVAGSGSLGYGGDWGVATQADFQSEKWVAMAPDGSLYIADSENHRIRRVSPDGLVMTVAGNGIFGYSGENGPATQAQLASPSGVAVGLDGSLYIADSFRVRRVHLMEPGLSFDKAFIPAGSGDEIYIFDAQGRHLQTLDALTGTPRYRFAYDGAGYLIQIIDGDGLTTTIERDNAGHPTAIIAPFGQRTTLSLDANGYLASLTTPAGDTTHFTSTADGLLTGMTTPNGHQYRFSYDPLGRLVRDDDPAGGFKTLTRLENAEDFSIRLTTALGRTHTYAVDRLPTGGTRRVNTDPRGLQNITEVGTDGIRHSTAPDGTMTTLLEGPDPRFGTQTPLLQSLTVTTPGGLTTTVSEMRTVALADPLDPLSLTQLTDTVTINGRAFTTTYEAASRTLTSLTPAGRQQVSLLDAQGRLLEQRVDGLDPVRFTYDALGRLNTLTHGSRTSILSYDGQGHLASLTDPLGRSVGFVYDLAGRLIRQTLPDGREILYSYDADGNLTSLTPPGRPHHAFAYTPVDLEAAYLPPELEAGPTSTQYAYNLDRQLVQVVRPDGTTLDVGYDSAGRLSTLTFPRGQLGVGYHPVTGHVATIIAPDGGTLSYAYDGHLLTEEAWSGRIAGSVEYTYDHDFRLTSQHVNGEALATFQYDADGLLTQAGALTLSRHPQHGLLTSSALGQITDTWTYTSYGEPETYRARFGGLEIFAVQYIRDALGRIVQKTETLEGQTTTYTYEYDRAGRLTQVQQNGSPVATYTYDSNGNRLSYTGLDGTVAGTYDVQDRLTQYGSTTYSYAANGELQRKTTGDHTTAYTYDALGNLTAVTLPDGTQIEYMIDGRNRRIGKQVNGALVQGFLYSGQLRPIAELDGSGAITARFVYGTRGNVPEYLVKGGRTYRILTDHLGSPRLVIDMTTGHIVQRLAYDAFGRVIYDDNPGFQPFGFAGGLYDPDTQLTRFGARDYDAETGRWTTKDPIRFLGGDPNLYGYVLNDPVNWVDPEGLTWRSVSKFFINRGVRALSNNAFDGTLPAGRRIISAGIGGAVSGAIVGAIVGTHALGIGAVPTAMGASIIGFSSGLLTQTIIEVFGLGQPIEDTTNAIFKGLKNNLYDQNQPQKHCKI
jgi:RHS repeat-associated protein